MRVKATRNADKNTPSPSAKKGRRGTARGTPKSAKKVSDLKPEVSCDPHVTTEEKVEEPIEKDDSQEEVGCKEGETVNEKDADHSDMIEDFASGDTLIRQNAEEAIEKDDCKEKEDINHPDIAEKVATTAQVDAVSEPVEMKEEHVKDSASDFQHAKEDGNELVGNVGNGKQVDEEIKEGSLNNNNNDEQDKDEEDAVEQVNREESGKQIDEAMKEDFVDDEDKDKLSKDEDKEVEEVEEVEEDEEDEEEEEDDDDDEEDVQNEEEGGSEETDDEENNVGEGSEEAIEPRSVTERKRRRTLEVFVGGLDKEATEDDVRKAFEVAGDIVEVRMMTHSQTGKNRGYAFVRFANADQAAKAAAELDKIKIRDRECAVVPSEDNDTLFVGNICKSWKSEQVLAKLKEYGVEGIDEMTLDEDPNNEGMNCGHAFLDFVVHNDAVKAFKRLSKPDAVFGCDRSARIAWAEASDEPDETVLARVKSVFVEGMPSDWNEAKLKELFGKYGEVDRVMMARNNPKSKRRDFAFVNFSTRDAALASIKALNDVELVEGDQKVKLKVELAKAKPAPRQRRMKGHRGSYPVGGSSSTQSKSKGDALRGDRFNRRRSDSGRVATRGRRDAMIGVKRKPVDDWPLRGERSRPSPKFPRAGAAVPSARREPRSGSLRDRHGSYGARGEDDYLPLGVRLSPRSGMSRGHYSSSRSRDYIPRQRGGGTNQREIISGYAAYNESSPRLKQPYPIVAEEAPYYERGYPRTRMEYAEPALVSGPAYLDSFRAPPLGSASLTGRNILASASIGSAASSSSLYASGSYGYANVPQGNSDYNYLAGATDPRGSYSSSYYDTSRPEYGLTRPEYGLSRTEYSSSRSEYGLTRPEYGSSRPEYGSSRGQYGSSRAEYGSTRTEYDLRRTGSGYGVPDGSTAYY